MCGGWDQKPLSGPRHPSLTPLAFQGIGFVAFPGLQGLAPDKVLQKPSSLFTSPPPTPVLAPAAAWAQHQDKRAVLLSTRLGQSSRGWTRVVLKGPSTVPSVTQQGFPNDERGRGEEKPISEEEGIPSPPPHIRLPTFASHFLCVATLQTRGDGGEESVSTGLLGQWKGWLSCLPRS